MLNDYRVLDLTDGSGIFCGYILAHLGAEVVALEPPGGRPERLEQKLLWQCYARGRASLEIDISAERQRFEQLVRESDFLIESSSMADRQRLGLGYEELAAINPCLIVVSITPFGTSGPRSDWPATDLTVWAASGALILSGDADRAPVRTSVPQSFLHAGGDAAGAALIALQERHRSGRGQHVDISGQVSSAQAVLSAYLGPANNSETVITREAGGLASVFPVRMTWPCKDGYVAITLLFGPAFTEPNRRVLRWVAEEGFCSAEIAELDWGIEIAAMVTAGAPPKPYFELVKQIEAFTMQHTQDELFEEGLARGVYIAPTLDIAGLVEEKHFHSRGYWQTLDVEDKSVQLPGPFAKLSETPLTTLGAAPDLNSFSGFSDRQEDAVKANDSSELPLAGLKVLDFMWVMAGPIFTRVLSDYGAEVIRVESMTRIDAVRASPPFKDNALEVSNSVPYSNFNAGKTGVTIDPSNPVGKEVILDLVRWADVVTESFSPKAMKAWGLDFESLKKVNPDLIMVSSCLMGQTGDRAMVPGYGNMAAAITGFYELTGWADRSPAGPYLAYTDGVSPRFMVATLMSAMEHKRKTGLGQHIDLSQAEAAIHFLAPAILNYGLNDEVWSRHGNRDDRMCPHGVFPAHGEDKWIAVACQNDAAWQAMCQVMSLDDLAADEALASVTGRKEREEELEDRMSAWTEANDAHTTQDLLIEAGVAAYVVQNAVDCIADPQNVARGHFISVEHSTVGEMKLENSRYRLSRTPAFVTRAGPNQGEHNFEVLSEVLGYDDDKIADVYASLAME